MGESLEPDNGWFNSRFLLGITIFTGVSEIGMFMKKDLS